MSDGPKEFFRQLLHQAIHAGVHNVMWRLPTFWLVVALAVMIGAVVYYGLY